MQKNVTMLTCFLLGCGLFLTGCASTSKQQQGQDPKDQKDPVAEWQKTRVMADKINALKKEGKLPTVNDLTYESLNHNNGIASALAAPIDLLAPTAAAPYTKVVNGVDKRYLLQGAIPLCQKRKAAEGKGEKFIPDNENDRKLLEDFDKYEKENPPDVLIPMLQEMLVSLGKLAEEVSSTVNDLLTKTQSGEIDLKEMGLKAIAATRNLGKDGVELGKQIGSATKGAKLWLELAELDRNLVNSQNDKLGNVKDESQK